MHVKDSNSSKSYDTYALRSVTVRYEITIVLDAGHGGSDPGAVSKSTGLKESDLNLQQTLILGNLLKANGFNVIYTRDKDIYPSLEERVNIANKINADLFISIHHDSAYPNTSVKGISTHYSTYRPLLDNERALYLSIAMFGVEILHMIPLHVMLQLKVKFSLKK